MTNYDLAIIGSGPGGYVAAIYASNHKLKTCVIEEDAVGGTCLNKGCIPTKALLHSAKILQTIKSSSNFGIDVSGYTVNFAGMIARKNEVVSRLRAGIETLFRANSVELFRGHAQVTGVNILRIEGAGEIFAKNIIIAAGSRAGGIPNVKIDETDILSSDGILNLKTIPKSLVVIGGGVIGCEFANLYNALGVTVTIVEYTDRLIPMQSREASKKLEMSFKKRGVDIFTKASAESIDKGAGLKVAISGSRTIEAEKVLVSVGRSANTESLGDLKSLGLEIDKGRIRVDAGLRTAVKNIYAIGDCVSGPQLAHKATYDAFIACDNILGKEKKADYSNVPNCIWTEPEVASVGLIEEEAKALDPGARVAKFPYLGSGRAYLEGKTEGFVKIIGDAKGNILGVEVFGEGACDLIAEAALARSVNVNIEEWGQVVHSHPTLSEMFQEAARAFCGKAIHGV